MGNTLFEDLLEGKKPSLEDYSFFVSIVENIDIETLWSIANTHTKLDDLLRSVVKKSLQEKIPKEKNDAHIASIIESLKHLV